MPNTYNPNALLKVLLVPNWYPSQKNSLVGSFFREQAQLLQENGYEFKVIKPTVIYVSLLKIIIDLCSLLLGKNVLIDSSSLVQNPPAYEVFILHNGRLAKINDYIYKFIIKRASIKILKSWQPDIIHGISFPDGVISANILSKFLKKPYVAVEHNTFLLHHLPHNLVGRILQSYKEAAAVGVVSEHQKKMVLMHQPDANPITVWNLIDESVFTIAPKRDNVFTIATITYPQPIKDYKTFLNAMYELSLLSFDFKYIMIGSDSWNDISLANSNKFKAYAETLGISDLGTFIPYVARENLSEVLNEVSVFVVTSIAETYGVAAREAMMCGIPVVTTACGGVEDAITKETGVIVPIRAHKEIARVIYAIANKNLIYNPQLIRDYSIKHFGKKRFVNCMKFFYGLGLKNRQN